MSQSPPPPPLPPTDALQFATVEPLAAGPLSPASPARICVGCKRPIASTYYALGDKIVCPACCAQVNAPPAGNKFGRLAKATLMGLGAGLVGALIWFAIRRLTGYEIGLVAVVVGLMVGKAVRAGSGGRGGRGYQILAVVLTYSCIAANYMPDVFEGLFKAAREHRSTTVSGKTGRSAGARGTSARENSSTSNTSAGSSVEVDSSNSPPAKIGAGKAVGAVFLLLIIGFLVALAAPFFAGIQNILGLLIIGFALWEAWKINARRQLPITGPYEIRPTPTPPGIAPTAGVTP